MFFNLTKRQLLCFGAAALIGVPIFFLVKATGNVSLAALSMMIVMLPLFFLAMYEKDGQPLEVVVEHFIQTKFVRPKVRPYQTDNYCINLDLQDVKALVSVLRICSNNLNQYAKRANETGSIYEADIKDLQERLETIWADMKEVLVRLSSIQ